MAIINTNEQIVLGLRDKDTKQLVAVYPYKINGDIENIEDKVMFWYYQQGCDAESKLKKLYVDALTKDELKERKPELH